MIGQEAQNLEGISDATYMLLNIPARESKPSPANHKKQESMNLNLRKQQCKIKAEKIVVVRPSNRQDS